MEQAVNKNKKIMILNKKFVRPGVKIVTVGKSINMGEPCKLYINMISQYSGQIQQLEIIIAQNEAQLQYFTDQLNNAGLIDVFHLGQINNSIALTNMLIQDYRHQLETVNSMLKNAEDQLEICLNRSTN